MAGSAFARLFSSFFLPALILDSTTTTETHMHGFLALTLLGSVLTFIAVALT
jgi:hypothetical protein